MKFEKPLPISLLLVTLCALATGPTIAQSETLDPQTAALQSELQRLNKNIERIALLLERSVESQNLDLLIQRVEMGSSRLSLAEQNLRSAQMSRSSIEDEKRELEARLGQLADELDSGTIDMPVEELERYTRDLGLHLTLLKERVRDADRQIIELENEVMSQRESVRDWQDYIDEKLTSGQ